MDETMQEEPVRRRPPRQLRSRTIGQVKWDSFFGYRNYDNDEGTLQDEVREPLPSEHRGSWYGLNARKGWSDHTHNLLHDPKPIGDEAVDIRMEEKPEMASDNMIDTYRKQQSHLQLSRWKVRM